MAWLTVAVVVAVLAVGAAAAAFAYAGHDPVVGMGHYGAGTHMQAPRSMPHHRGLAMPHDGNRSVMPMHRGGVMPHGDWREW